MSEVLSKINKVLGEKELKEYLTPNNALKLLNNKIKEAEQKLKTAQHNYEPNSPVVSKAEGYLQALRDVIKDIIKIA